MAGALFIAESLCERFSRPLSRSVSRPRRHCEITFAHEPTRLASPHGEPAESHLSGTLVLETDSGNTGLTSAP